MSHSPHSVEWTDEKVARFWDFYARNKSGDFFSDLHSGDLAERIISAAHPRTFLDIGCGTGPLVIALAQRGVQCVGVDSSPGVLEEARRATSARGLEATFLEGSGVSIPVPDGAVDCAALVEVVEHLDDATLSRVLTEAYRVVHPGGALIITTPNREDLRLSTVQCPDCGAEFHLMQHVRVWTRTSLQQSIELAGFRVSSISGVRFVPNGGIVGRVARKLYYALRGQRPRLIAIAIRPV